MGEEKIEYTVIRRGSCNKCGYCCENTNCPDFDKKSKLCKIHEDKPDECRKIPEFPMRKSNPKCGYGFYIKGHPELEVTEMSCIKVRKGNNVALSGVAYIQVGAFFKDRIPDFQKKLNEFIEEGKKD